MQPLYNTTILQSKDSENASALIEAILLGMRIIRKSMRGARPGDISLPQFRTLTFIRNHKGASLSDASEYIGLTLPSMSRAIDALVKRGFVERIPSTEDRRRVILSLTSAGQSVIEAADKAACERFAEILASLPQEKYSEVINAANTLRSLLACRKAGCGSI